ncbi:MAG TPA: twin-arginine translocase TatA/TatE family subunit [Solirubrobacteraceae bacterium]|jgi:sec-independent protein translocase protein TatA
MGLENPLHIAVLVVLVLLVFGAKRLPEIGRSLGTGMREFKDSITGESKQPSQPTISQAAPPASPPPAAAQPAAAAFGTPPPEQAAVPAEPTRPA